MNQKLNILIGTRVTYQLLDLYSFQFNLTKDKTGEIFNFLVLSEIRFIIDGDAFSWVCEKDCNFNLDQLITNKYKIVNTQWSKDRIVLSFESMVELILIIDGNYIESIEMEYPDGSRFIF